MDMQLKKGDKVIVTIGAAKGDTGTITEIRDGVKYSVQVMFPGQTVSTPYAPDELELLEPCACKRLDPVITLCIVILLALVIGYALLTASVNSEHQNKNIVDSATETKLDSVYDANTVKPLSDTVARIPNP